MLSLHAENSGPAAAGRSLATVTVQPSQDAESTARRRPADLPNNPCVQIHQQHVRILLLAAGTGRHQRCWVCTAQQQFTSQVAAQVAQM
jgi:hypothetical protein